MEGRNITSFEETTIAAISTAMSASGIGIVRISGPEAFEVASEVYRSKGGKKMLKNVPSHTIHYGYIYDNEEMVDEVLVMTMRAPRTYTGEDTIEIDCHGGVLAMQKVLETVLKHGAVIAEPGEFTKRAFLNGRIDLSQAEAVMDVIQSKNEYALKNSVNQLKGNVRKTVQRIREKILYHIAYIESALDDPEHYDLEGYPEELEEIVEQESAEIEGLLKSSADGKIMQEGLKTVILGKPNAGKSSLLNMLLGEERAIVTDIAGTTRDVLEEYINLHGVTLRVADTAGIRQTEDLVEQIGVTKAREMAADADLILYVVDSSKPLDENDRDIIKNLLEKKTIVLYSKTDLESAIKIEEIQEMLELPVIPVSAKEETGVRELEEKIREMFFSGEINFNDEVYITNERHRQELIKAKNSLALVKNSIEAGMPEDFFSIDLTDAYESLGRILGESMGEDLVNEIFSKFCMGK
nr:tRNA uridine-5-carboxymethylaminomethyl(34) synthesis GTPase MnmE [uncultured Blautia sp.]